MKTNLIHFRSEWCTVVMVHYAKGAAIPLDRVTMVVEHVQRVQRERCLSYCPTRDPRQKRPELPRCRSKSVTSCLRHVGDRFEEYAMKTVKRVASKVNEDRDAPYLSCQCIQGIAASFHF